MKRSPWWAVAVWAGAILVGTSIPGHDLPPAFPHADKLVHLTLYGGLGLLAARAVLLGRRPAGVARRPRARLAGVLVAVALFGAVDEWHQDFVPGRSSDRFDWLADVIGATAGLSAAATLLRSEQRT